MLLQYGNNALHIAAANGVIKVTKLLIANGCNLNATDTVCYIYIELYDLPTSPMLQDGRSVLHMATDYGQSEIVSLLINHGCDISVTDKVSNLQYLMY